MSIVTSKFPSVTIGGTVYELVPTLKAVRQLTNAGGGLLAAYRRVMDMDMDVIASVISAGADLTFGKPAEFDAFVEAVWKEPRDNYSSGVSEFFSLLFNGGKVKSDDAAEKKVEKKPVSEGNG